MNNRVELYIEYCMQFLLSSLIEFERVGHTWEYKAKSNKDTTVMLILLEHNVMFHSSSVLTIRRRDGKTIHLRTL